MRILVIEDREEELQKAVLILQKKGHEVVTARRVGLIDEWERKDKSAEIEEKESDPTWCHGWRITRKNLMVEETADHLSWYINGEKTNENYRKGTVVRERTPLVDGVITDVFTPYMPGDSDNEPAGAMVAVMAHAYGIPCIICTSGYHHGERYHWLCGLGRTLYWPEMVDGVGAGKNKEGEKDWNRAVDELLELIDKNKK